MGGRLMIVLLIVIMGVLVGLAPLLWRHPVGRVVVMLGVPVLGIAVLTIMATRVVGGVLGYMLTPMPLRGRRADAEYQIEPTRYATRRIR